MKRITILLLATLALTACKTEKKTIEFKKIVNLDLGNMSKESAKIRGTAVFMNLSDEAYTLKDMVLDFTIDGKDVGTVVIKTNKVVQPNSEFSVAIQYPYETTSVVEAGHDPSSSYAVQLIGDLNAVNEQKEEISASVKFADTYKYQTPKEQRQENRDTRKEERKQRREERKAGKE